MSAQCLACGEGTLHPYTEENAVDIHGQTISVPLQYSTCDHCGAELTNADQARAKKSAMVAAEKQAFGLLSGTYILVFRKRHLISQADASLLFCGGKVGFSRYENDDIVQSQSMDSLLRLCMQQPTTLIRLARMRGVNLAASADRGIHASAHLHILQIAPMIQKILDDAMAQDRKAKALPASNDLKQDGFEVTERSTWTLAA
jgi:HTH-type transcriptional regulator/antitoxin MqsA